MVRHHRSQLRHRHEHYVRYVLALLLLASVSWAADTSKAIHIEDGQQHVFPGGIGLPGPLQATCNDVIPPPTPTVGEIMYCKAGFGWCALDTGGNERCTGGGGGGSTSFGSITNGTNTTATMIVGSGAVLDTTGTGVIGGTLRDNGGAVVNVKHRAYGAVGDGVTDDTTAVYAAANAVTSGGTLLFPAGTYIINPASVAAQNRVLNSNITIRCEGNAVIKRKAAVYTNNADN